MSSPDIDWAEFENDYQSREFIQDINQRLEGLLSGLQSAKILHDWDNYQAALTDYGYTQYKKGSGAVGYDAKINELRQFFMIFIVFFTTVNFRYRYLMKLKLFG